MGRDSPTDAITILFSSRTLIPTCMNGPKLVTNKVF